MVLQKRKHRVSNVGVSKCSDMRSSGLYEALGVVSGFVKSLSKAKWNYLILFAVNHEYVHADYLLKDGDEVAFFPPVTGG